MTHRDLKALLALIELLSDYGFEASYYNDTLTLNSVNNKPFNRSLNLSRLAATGECAQRRVIYQVCRDLIREAQQLKVGHC